MFEHLLLTIVIGIVIIGQLRGNVPFLRKNESRQRKEIKACKKQSQTTAPTKCPPCPACAADEGVQEGEMETVDAPPMIEQTRGRPRSVDTSSHYCPRKSCRYYGWLGRCNIRANGHPNGGRWRQLQCVVCNKCFMETWTLAIF